MKKNYSKTRYIALLCSFIIVFSLVMTGCASVKKISKKSTSTSGDEIQIGQGSDILEGETQIVVGDDGQSYIVDEEGHSVIYNNSTQSGGSYSASEIATTAGTAATTSKTAASSKTTTTKKSTASTTKATTVATTQTPSEVYNSLAYQRTFGFNKYYDMGSMFVNFYLSTIRVYFTYDDKDWLIELWKGEYAMATVGCEVGFYYRNHNQTLLDTVGADWLLYKSVEDEDAMPVSMKLWQYEKSTDSTPVLKIDYGKRNCWWAADFETGVLETHRDKTTLVMIATIDFPTTKMMELFTEQLDNKGFKEGSINSYHNVERYSVDGRTVTICWKNYDED
jgi:hypothetical protein